MSNLSFKSCASCGRKRAWYLERCPKCNDDDFKTTVEDGDSMAENAIGDSVMQPLLFNEEVSALDISEDRRVVGIFIRKLRQIVSKTPISTGEKSPELTVQLLNNPISNYLSPNERPHFILRADVIQREQENEVSELKPSSEFHSAQIVVTNRRIRFLIGQDHGDVVRSVEHADVTRVEFSEGLLHTSLSIQTATTAYHVPDCEPSDEVDPTAAYIQGQSEGGYVDRENKFNYEKGTTKHERVATVFRDINLTQAVNLGGTGAKVGRRFGPKGTALGFVIGVGFGIWADLSQTDTSAAEAPDPEDVARNVKQWQQAGNQTGNERAEWLSSATGAAISIAAQNSDRQSVQELKNIDADGVASAIQAGSELMGTSNMPVAQRGHTDIAPEITNVRRPVTELTSTTAALFEAGLFDELIAAQNEYEGQ